MGNRGLEETGNRKSKGESTSTGDVQETSKFETKVFENAINKGLKPLARYRHELNKRVSTLVEH